MNPSTDSIENTLGIAPGVKKSRKRLVAGGLLLLFLIGGGVYYVLKSKANSAVVYQTSAVERKTLTTTVSATGALEPTNTIEIGIEVSGTIEEVFVDYNDRVTKGQIMARLDTAKLTSAVESSKATLAKYQANAAEAKATLSNATNEWERVHQIYTATNGNYPSKQDLDDARTSMEKAKAQLNAAIAQTRQGAADLSTNENNLHKAIVVSPTNGIVLERKIERGQTVVAAMETPVLFTMAENLTKMKVILSIDEADIGEVKEGQKVNFSVDAYPNQTFHGLITQLRLNSETVNGVVTYDAVVEVDNGELLLRPGMTVSAQIITGLLENVLTVPNAALRFTPPSDEKSEQKKEQTKNANDVRYVWILRNKKPVKVSIKIGKSDGLSTIVSDKSIGIGDSVITGVKGE